MKRVNELSDRVVFQPDSTCEIEAPTNTKITIQKITIQKITMSEVDTPHSSLLLFTPVERQRFFIRQLMAPVDVVPRVVTPP